MDIYSLREKDDLAELASGICQDAAEGCKLACRVSCVTKPNWLIVSWAFLGFCYGKGLGLGWGKG